ncbi:hypothetical protein D4R89_10465 [bacterium]|nr:MAG: hypothetical protein D4R89_10465 [bacterium]
MERKKMKRVNVILEADLYDKARIVAFVKRKSLSAIVRGALSEWLTRNVDAGTELLIAEKDEKRLLKILASDEFIPAESAKKTLGL